MIAAAIEHFIGAGKNEKMLTIFTLNDAIISVALYSIGAWFLFNFRDKLNAIKWFWTVPAYLLIILFYILMCVYNAKTTNNMTTNWAIDTTKICSLPSVITSIVLIQLFQMIKFKENNNIHEWLHKYSMWLGETVLLIYLYHGWVYELLEVKSTWFYELKNLDKFFFATFLVWLGSMLSFYPYVWGAKEIEKGLWLNN